LTKNANLVSIIKNNQATWATAIVKKLEESEPWFKSTNPNHRAWLTLITQRGINAFADWLEGTPNQFSTASFFENEAPRDLALAINFEQIVSVTQKIFTYVENELLEILDDDEKSAVQVQLLRFSRDIAFATALAYARAAEVRSAWDARLEAKIIDALIDGENFNEIEVNAAGLGWSEVKNIFTIVGKKPQKDSALAVAEIHRAARNQDLLTIAGVRGEMLIALISNSINPESAARYFSPRFGEGSIVYGRVVDNFGQVLVSTKEAIAGYLAKEAAPQSQRVISASQLLPERAINADPLAQSELIEIYSKMKTLDPDWLNTLEAFFECGGSLEATARSLHIHVNTVRYRFKGIEQAIGLSPTKARDGYLLQVAISLGRLKQR